MYLFIVCRFVFKTVIKTKEEKKEKLLKSIHASCVCSDVEIWWPFWFVFFWLVCAFRDL